MSYTSVELVRHHLVAAFPVQQRIRNQPVTLENDYAAFFNGAVEEATVTVKSVQQVLPLRKQVTLGSSWTNVDSAPLVDGSVAVASDSSLGTVYGENVDYVVDYSQGNILRKSGGSLSVGQSVTV
ncbi:MAG: hypothetical protein AB1744_06115, partial [Candidatus Zixiibacteriota bacterium]